MLFVIKNFLKDLSAADTYNEKKDSVTGSAIFFVECTQELECGRTSGEDLLLLIEKNAWYGVTIPFAVFYCLNIRQERQTHILGFKN